eukprot:m.80134 g.80134  ORF g.80134 m.80134 type:complete len:652 (+) comp25285_c0_seq1:378-2333(+)
MSSGLDTAIETWRDIDLTALQRTLDEEAEEIGKKREAAEASRKQLVDATKAFRTSVDPNVRKAVTPLMKQFQLETDNLTKRSKNVEKAFFAIYKKLADAPDPCTLLEGVHAEQKQSVANQELLVENEKLQKTIKEYHDEFAEIKNQEVTVKRLEEKLAEYEKNMESTIATRLAERERQLQRDFAEKERELNEDQVGIATRLGAAEQAAANAHDALDATQSELFDMKSKYDEDISAKASELELLASDLDHANLRILTLQRELETERERMAYHQEGVVPGGVEHDIDALTLSNLEKEVASKDQEVVQMIDTNRELQRDLVQLKQTNDTRISGFETALQARAEEIQELKLTIEQQKDYEQIKNEVQMFKSVEFGDSAAIDDTVESMLMRKNRMLEAENTDIKIRLTDVTTQLASLKSEENDATSKVHKQEELITQLEGDLTAIKTYSNPGGAVVTETVQQFGDSGTLGERQDESLLNIVSSQRDRFRARNFDLEAEARHQKQIVAALRSEIDTVKSDNVKLYEKIKFIQGYKPQSRTSEATVDKYSKEYEEHINPFQAFNQKEKQRKYQSLSPVDKMVHAVIRIVLSNQQARMVFVVYIMLIHFLIFVVLMRISHTTGCSKSDLAEQCMLRYAAHMQHIHHSDFLEDATNSTGS